MKIFLSPHNDDETLFAAFTVMRHQPLVAFVIDCYQQEHRSPSVTAEQRREESRKACEVLGVPCVFLGVRDDTLTLDRICDVLKPLRGFDAIYAPARQGGHTDHDLVSIAASVIFGGDRVAFYSTYSKDRPDYVNDGVFEIKGTAAEWTIKRKAMDCYRSQHVWSRGHFAAVQGKSEWLS